MKKIIFIFIFLVYLSGVFAQSAIDISIETKKSFSLNNEIGFDYTISSNIDEEITYFATISCPNASAPLLDLQTVFIKSGEEYKGTYSYGLVTSNMEPQLCKASITIIKPSEITKKEEFEIIALPSFEFNFFVCKDASCSEKSKVFIQSENIYLYYDSTVENPQIKTTLTYPDETIKNLILPISITAEQIGVYQIEIRANKEGYKNITETEQFAVIKQNAVIKSESRCNADGICDNNENYQSCPQDCIASSKSLKEKLNLQLILIITIAVIIILIAILIKIRINKKNRKEKK